MSYAKPTGVLGGAIATNGALAATGFSSLLWAEVALVLIVVGFVLLRLVKMRRLAAARGAT